MTTTADEPVTGELVHYTPQVAEEYRPRMLMAPDEAAQIDQALRDMMRAVLHADVDYGVIPGTNKPSLYKPGAEKLLQWFGFGHAMERVEIERDADGGRLGVTYRCTVTKAMPDGRVIVVATCEGYAGYDEERFYQTAEQAQAKAKAQEEKWARKDKRQPNPAKWQNITEYRAPWNSVIKMCQKRALVGAALQATSGSTLFTQDVEDTTEPASPGASIASAASEVIASLPEEARRGVEAWRKEQDWPRSSEWDAAQWCAALVQAGRQSQYQDMKDNIISRGKSPEPETDAWATPTGSDGGWPEEAEGLILAAPDVDACRAIYRLAVAKANLGEISAEDRQRICDLAAAQADDLAKNAAPVEGTVAAPDGDPWQAEINAMTTQEDALPLLDKLEQARGSTVDERRYKALKAGIRSKASGLPSAPEAVPA